MRVRELGATDLAAVEQHLLGRKLAEEALRRAPGLKVLFTTGYTRNAIVHNNMLDPDVSLIAKPSPWKHWR